MTVDQVLHGDALTMLKTLPACCVQCVVTSPPYYGLRDYGTATWIGGDPKCDHKGTRITSPKMGNRDIIPTHTGDCPRCDAVRQDQQIGLEETPQQYIEKLVAVFREVRRVLRDDGTVWLNIGDSYAGGAGGRGDIGRMIPRLDGSTGGTTRTVDVGKGRINRGSFDGLKPKDLMMIPARVAIALQDDGWYLRSSIIWHKPNAMPESVTDRPTSAHEHVFLLAKSERYFYDADAIREPQVCDEKTFYSKLIKQDHKQVREYGYDSFARTKEGLKDATYNPAGRNKRNVWTIATQSFPEAHFATMPPKLVEPCILAGTSPRACEHCGAPWERVTERLSFGKAESNTKYSEKEQAGPLARSRQGYRAMGLEGPPPPITIGWQPICTCPNNTGCGRCIVLDPFCGAGTVPLVAIQHHRSWLGIELNHDYIELTMKRIGAVQPVLWEEVPA